VSDHDLLITSGVGPIEARRFIAQLAARLEELAVARGLEVRDVAADGDAPRSITLRLRGDVLGQLVDEVGTHVLVAAIRGRGARKRWFAAVSVRATIVEGTAAPIARAELVVTACRASGPGGQHVNKVSSAVRVHHVPSGIVIRSAAARSQQANLDHALRRLAEVMQARAAAGIAAARATTRAAHYRVERGRPVRAYELDRDGQLVERSQR
jgi:peptide chain release factor 2/peptide chain release factor